jgi:uncharacterized protein YbjQ (UPF0145 family)
MKCSECGQRISVMATLSKRSNDGLCTKCNRESRRQLRVQREKTKALEVKKEVLQVKMRGTGDWQEANERRLTGLASSVVVSTTPSLEGWHVQKYLGIVSVEFVIGTGPISEFVSELQDFFGARSSLFEQKLQLAKQAAFERLKYRAAEKGGNAVVSVDIDYIDFSGNRIGLILNGTVVSVVQED